MLRYLLTRPVTRTRLLTAKLIGTMSFVVFAVVLVAITSYITGVLAFGSNGLKPVSSSSTSGGISSAARPACPSARPPPRCPARRCASAS